MACRHCSASSESMAFSKVAGFSRVADIPLAVPCLEPLLPLLLAAAADGCFHRSLGWRGVLAKRPTAVGGWDDEGSELDGSSGSSSCSGC